MTENPIYTRLKRAGKPPLEVASYPLTVIAAAVSSVIGFGSLVGSLVIGSTVPLILAWTVIALTLICTFIGPAVVMVSVAIHTARQNSVDQFDLIRLTMLSPKQIVKAYLTEAERRYTPASRLAAGLWPGASTAAVVLKAVEEVGTCIPVKVCTGRDVELAILLTLFVSGILYVPMFVGIATTSSIYSTAMVTGVWAALRWPEHNLKAVALILLGYAIAVMLLIAAVMMLTRFWQLACILALVLPVIGMTISTLMQNQLDHVLDDRAR